MESKYITIRIKAPRIDHIYFTPEGKVCAVIQTGNSVVDMYYHDLVSEEAKDKIAELVDIIYKELEAE